VEKAVNWLLQHHAGQTIAAVTHGGVLDVLYRRATGRRLHTPRDFLIPNCSLNWFQFDGHGWHLESGGDRHYLHEVLTQPPE
jgi:probable phosphoglycerate mutase